MVGNHDVPNGRIKMTFGQVVWAATTLVVLTGAWYDMRNQIRLVADEVTRQGDRIEALEAHAERSVARLDRIVQKEARPTTLNPRPARKPATHPPRYRQPPIYGRPEPRRN